MHTIEEVTLKCEAMIDVISIPELLEEILRNVDFQTLLLAQRVDKDFRDLISSSVHLQKKLFMENVKSFKKAEGLYMVTKGTMRFRISQALSEEALIDDGMSDYYESDVSSSDCDERCGIVNTTSFFKIPDGSERLRPRNRMILERQYNINTTTAMPQPASWNRMYITQPPILKRVMVIVGIAWRRPTDADVRCGSISFYTNGRSKLEDMQKKADLQLRKRKPMRLELFVLWPPECIVTDAIVTGFT